MPAVTWWLRSPCQGVAKDVVAARSRLLTPVLRIIRRVKERAPGQMAS
ncbi:MAG: hypothetical protein ACKVQQ_17255 [Burkholderiales bacterium]